jgi:hypothetical protein
MSKMRYTGHVVDEVQLEKQQRAKSGFIRAFGMFWSRDEVDWWGEEGDLQLLGRINKNRGALQVVNFWDQRGIYVLYNDHGPYYVGKTFDQALGVRLSQHQKEASPHRESWNRFSWFGWRRVLKGADPTGLQRLGQVPAGVLTDSRSSVADIEALLIEALGTRWVGNARSESFAAAVRWEQVLWNKQAEYLGKLTG